MGGFLGEEDPLEKETQSHSSILVWETPWTEKPAGLQSTGWQRAGHDQVGNTFTFTCPNEHTSFYAPPSGR